MLRSILDLIVRAFSARRDAAAAPAPAPTSPEAAIPIPPAATKLPGVDLAALTKPHGIFDSKAKWYLTPKGLSIDGAPPKGTPGEPLTARRAFEYFGVEFRAAAREFGVPIELVAATACTEAGIHIAKGKEAARMSERREPGFTSYAATPHRVSIGVMHTLLSTARQALAEPGLQAIDLCSPSTSIRAGAAYIAQQKRVTGFDPPLVGAAYNAGGIYDVPNSALKFSLRQYPIGTDEHVSRFCAFFNDVWGLVQAKPELAAGAPSFVKALVP